MDMKTYLSSVCHTSGFRFALPVKLWGAHFVKENQDRLGVSFESLRGGVWFTQGKCSTVACVGPDVLQSNFT